MTVKSLSSAFSSGLGGSEAALADNAGFCMSCLTALVPPWEQCTSAATVTLWWPEGHITGEADLALLGSECLWLSIIGGGGLLAAHIDAISESEYSDERLSDSTLTGDLSACLDFLVNSVVFSTGLLFSDLFYIPF
jgi:hypothetical protein